MSHIASLSDHCGVKVRINLDLNVPLSLPSNKDFSYWKLNIAVLSEDTFMPCFKVFWKEIVAKTPCFDDVALWCNELAKPKIKEFCIYFSKRRKEARSITKQFLLAYMRVALENKRWSEVGRIQEQLSQMLKEDLMRLVVKSRFQQNAEEKRGSLFHAGQELKNSWNNILQSWDFSG